MKKIFLIIALLISACTVLTACDNNAPTGGTDTPSESNITIKVTSTIKEVSVGHTITVRVLVSGTAKRDVTWSSSNTDVATVDGGKVTGISEGKANITATLTADTNISTSVEVTVIAANTPTSIEIEDGDTTNGWVGEDKKINVSIKPENADPRLIYETSNANVATVDENGNISFISAGEVEVTVSSLADPSISDKITYNVKKGMFFTNKGGYADNIDYSNQADEVEPYIITKNTLFDGDNPAALAWFNADATTKYYAEATFNITATTNDAWSRVGIGTGTNDNDTRGFYFSDKEGHKTFMMDLPNTWGASVARTMIWQVNGIRNFDPTNITIGVLRDGNDYYYTINGSLYWFETTNKFNDMGTLPVVLSKDASFIITNAKYINDNNVLDTMINSAEYAKKFFNSGSSTGQVTVVSDTEFIFHNIYDNEDNYRFRDQCVKSYGDKGAISGDFVIEFDVVGYQNVVNDINSMLGIALRRYDSDEPVICDSIMLDDQSFQFRTWNYDSQFSYGTISNVCYNSSQFSSLTSQLETVHVRIERKVGNISSTFKIYLNDVEYKFFDATGAEKELKINYTGKYLIMIGSNNAKGTIKNFSFRQIEK